MDRNRLISPSYLSHFSIKLHSKNGQVHRMGKAQGVRIGRERNATHSHLTQTKCREPVYR
jgi:hypothetical protein